MTMPTGAAHHVADRLQARIETERRKRQRTDQDADVASATGPVVQDNGTGTHAAPGPRGRTRTANTMGAAIGGLADLVAAANRSLGDIPAGMHVVVQDVTGEAGADGNVYVESTNDAYVATLRSHIRALTSQGQWRSGPGPDGNDAGSGGVREPECFFCEFGNRMVDNMAGFGCYAYDLMLERLEKGAIVDDIVYVCKDVVHIFDVHIWHPLERVAAGRPMPFRRLVLEDVLFHVKSHVIMPEMIRANLIRTMERSVFLLDEELRKNGKVDLKVNAEKRQSVAQLYSMLKDVAADKAAQGRQEQRLDPTKLYAAGSRRTLEPFFQRVNMQGVPIHQRGGHEGQSLTFTQLPTTNHARPALTAPGTGSRPADTIDDLFDC